jgi:tripartite ATP-independent transporter DctP family solute receptor
MKKAYLVFGFLLGLVLASFLFALIKPKRDQTEGDVKRFTVAHVLPTNHPVHAGIAHFAERAAFHSGGKLIFEIFPNGQLGSETQNLEQMQSGTLDVAKVGGATLGSFVPATKVFSLPYLFRNSAHYWNVLNSDLGHEMLDLLATNEFGAPSGFRGLTYYDSGSRNFYAKKPIMHPRELHGMKIRVTDDPVAIDLMRAMGASPTPISFGELYTALQQGVVDGAENNPPSFIASRHFEVCKDFTLSHHTRIPDVLVIADKTWSGLTEEQKGWVLKAAAESSEFQRQAWELGTNAALAEMKANGVRIHEPDLTPFMEISESVRDKHATGTMKSLVERIQSTPDQ